jgi:hypothetical protein
MVRKCKGRGLYIGKYSPPWGGGISADVIWGKKISKGKEKKGECKKEERGKKMRKGQVKG